MNDEGDAWRHCAGCRKHRHRAAFYKLGIDKETSLVVYSDQCRSCENKAANTRQKQIAAGRRMKAERDQMGFLADET